MLAEGTRVRWRVAAPPRGLPSGVVGARRWLRRRKRGGCAGGNAAQTMLHDAATQIGAHAVLDVGVVGERVPAGAESAGFTAASFVVERMRECPRSMTRGEPAPVSPRRKLAVVVPAHIRIARSPWRRSSAEFIHGHHRIEVERSVDVRVLVVLHRVKLPGRGESSGVDRE